MVKKENDFNEKSLSLLKELFNDVETKFKWIRHTIPQNLNEILNILFNSQTQSYREALLGCGIAKCIDQNIDIRLPYTGQGSNSFNGRTLDEKIINPFLQENNIPCSKGPYLATFRRNVKFTIETIQGLRDKNGYNAFLNYLSEFENATPDQLKNLIKYILIKFLELRESSDIALLKISRLTLEQYENLINSLLDIPSGGLIPVFLTVAMFKTINISFDLNWNIQCQGINVADKASGAGGDITITKDDKILLAVEVTEREIDRNRVVATFNTKIAPKGIEDYLFFSTSTQPTDDAKTIATQYFAHGHDVSFLHINSWIINLLGTIGTKKRSTFINELVELMNNKNVSASIKVKWNDLIKKIV